MAEFATNAKSNAALATGIIGASGVGLGLLNNLGILGGTQRAVCSDEIPVNRYEAAQAAKISELETEIKLRDANTFTLGEVGKLRDYFERRIDKVEHEISDQKVYNATMNGAVGCIQAQITQLMALTKLVVPNTSICPGWGDVTVTTSTSSATT